MAQRMLIAPFRALIKKGLSKTSKYQDIHEHEGNPIKTIGRAWHRSHLGKKLLPATLWIQKKIRQSKQVFNDWHQTNQDILFNLKGQDGQSSTPVHVSDDVLAYFKSSDSDLNIDKLLPENLQSFAANLKRIYGGKNDANNIPENATGEKIPQTTIDPLDLYSAQAKQMSQETKLKQRMNQTIEPLIYTAMVAIPKEIEACGEGDHAKKAYLQNLQYASFAQMHAYGIDIGGKDAEHAIAKKLLAVRLENAPTSSLTQLEKDYLYDEIGSATKIIQTETHVLNTLKKGSNNLAQIAKQEKPIKEAKNTLRMCIECLSYGAEGDEFKAMVKDNHDMLNYLAKDQQSPLDDENKALLKANIGIIDDQALAKKIKAAAPDNQPAFDAVLRDHGIDADMQNHLGLSYTMPYKALKRQLKMLDVLARNTDSVHLNPVAHYQANHHMAQHLSDQYIQQIALMAQEPIKNAIADIKPMVNIDGSSTFNQHLKGNKRTLHAFGRDFLKTTCLRSMQRAMSGDDFVHHSQIPAALKLAMQSRYQGVFQDIEEPYLLDITSKAMGKINIPLHYAEKTILGAIVIQHASGMLTGPALAMIFKSIPGAALFFNAPVIQDPPMDMFAVSIGATVGSVYGSTPWEYKKSMQAHYSRALNNIIYPNDVSASAAVHESDALELSTSSVQIGGGEAPSSSALDTIQELGNEAKEEMDNADNLNINTTGTTTEQHPYHAFLANASIQTAAQHYSKTYGESGHALGKKNPHTYAWAKQERADFGSKWRLIGKKSVQSVSENVKDIARTTLPMMLNATVKAYNQKGFTGMEKLSRRLMHAPLVHESKLVTGKMQSALSGQKMLDSIAGQAYYVLPELDKLEQTLLDVQLAQKNNTDMAQHQQHLISSLQDFIAISGSPEKAALFTRMLPQAWRDNLQTSIQDQNNSNIQDFKTAMQTFKDAADQQAYFFTFKDGEQAYAIPQHALDNQRHVIGKLGNKPWRERPDMMPVSTQNGEPYIVKHPSLTPNANYADGTVHVIPLHVLSNQRGTQKDRKDNSVMIQKQGKGYHVVLQVYDQRKGRYQTKPYFTSHPPRLVTVGEGENAEQQLVLDRMSYGHNLGSKFKRAMGIDAQGQRYIATPVPLEKVIYGKPETPNKPKLKTQ